MTSRLLCNVFNNNKKFQYLCILKKIAVKKITGKFHEHDCCFIYFKVLHMYAILSGKCSEEIYDYLEFDSRARIILELKVLFYLAQQLTFFTEIDLSTTYIFSIHFYSFNRSASSVGKKLL